MDPRMFDNLTEDNIYQGLASSWRPGDILYGTGMFITLASIALSARGLGPAPDVPRGGAPGRIVAQAHLTNAVWPILEAKNEIMFADDAAIARSLVDARRGVDFRQFLRGHGRYNVEADPRSTAQYLGHKWRRTSKGGLEFQIRRGGQVHFLIDEIFGAIATIATKFGTGQSITSSELRWLYRHRAMRDVQRLVRFWTLGGGEVPAANVFSDPAWGLYNPTNTYETSWEKTVPGTSVHDLSLSWATMVPWPSAGD